MPVEGDRDDLSASILADTGVKGPAVRWTIICATTLSKLHTSNGKEKRMNLMARIMFITFLFVWQVDLTKVSLRTRYFGKAI